MPHQRVATRLENSRDQEEQQNPERGHNTPPKDGCPTELIFRRRQPLEH
jgi:hypothetical protein